MDKKMVDMGKYIVEMLNITKDFQVSLQMTMLPYN